MTRPATMGEVVRRLLELLSHSGLRADGLAEAICDLIVEGGRLGELEEYLVADPFAPGGVKTCRRPPAVWFARLLAAAEGGAFGRMTARKVVERILSTPDPQQT